MPNDKKGKGGTYIPETAYLGTDGGPASAPAKADRPAVKQAKLVGEVAGSMPHNDTKASEYDPAGAPPADRRCSRTSFSARRSPTSTMSASPSASCTPVVPGPMASSNASTASSISLARLPSPKRASRRRCSYDSPPWPGRAAPRTPPGTCAVLPSSSTPIRATGIWWPTTCRCSSFRMQSSFPTWCHAVKPEPHHAMPQAASAHDTFWDFVSLMPESTHMLMWQMSDRAIPRSYRMMQGFGVHTFRFVTREGKATFVKFHLTPKLGTHSLVWDEAVKIAGADPDFHRRDLWEAIDAGE